MSENDHRYFLVVVERTIGKVQKTLYILRHLKGTHKANFATNLFLHWFESQLGISAYMEIPSGWLRYSTIKPGSTNNRENPAFRKSTPRSEKSFLLLFGLKSSIKVKRRLRPPQKEQ